MTNEGECGGVFHKGDDNNISYCKWDSDNETCELVRENNHGSNWPCEIISNNCDRSFFIEGQDPKGDISDISNVFAKKCVLQNGNCNIGDEGTMVRLNSNCLDQNRLNISSSLTCMEEEINDHPFKNICSQPCRGDGTPPFEVDKIFKKIEGNEMWKPGVGVKECNAEDYTSSYRVEINEGCQGQDLNDCPEIDPGLPPESHQPNLIDTDSIINYMERGRRGWGDAVALADGGNNWEDNFTWQKHDCALSNFVVDAGARCSTVCGTIGEISGYKEITNISNNGYQLELEDSTEGSNYVWRPTLGSCGENELDDGEILRTPDESVSSAEENRLYLYKECGNTDQCPQPPVYASTGNVEWIASQEQEEAVKCVEVAEYGYCNAPCNIDGTPAKRDITYTCRTENGSGTPPCTPTQGWIWEDPGPESGDLGRWVLDTPADTDLCKNVDIGEPSRENTEQYDCTFTDGGECSMELQDAYAHTNEDPNSEWWVKGDCGESTSFGNCDVPCKLTGVEGNREKIWTTTKDPYNGYRKEDRDNFYRATNTLGDVVSGDEPPSEFLRIWEEEEGIQCSSNEQVPCDDSTPNCDQDIIEQCNGIDNDEAIQECNRRFPTGAGTDWSDCMDSLNPFLCNTNPDSWPPPQDCEGNYSRCELKNATELDEVNNCVNPPTGQAENYPGVSWRKDYTITNESKKGYSSNSFSNWNEVSIGGQEKALTSGNPCPAETGSTHDCEGGDDGVERICENRDCVGSLELEKCTNPCNGDNNKKVLKWTRTVTSNDGGIKCMDVAAAHEMSGTLPTSFTNFDIDGAEITSTADWEGSIDSGKCDWTTHNCRVSESDDCKPCNYNTVGGGVCIVGDGGVTSINNISSSGDDDYVNKCRLRCNENKNCTGFSVDTEDEMDCKNYTSRITGSDNRGADVMCFKKSGYCNETNCNRECLVSIRNWTGCYSSTNMASACQGGQDQVPGLQYAFIDVAPGQGDSTGDEPEDCEDVAIAMAGGEAQNVSRHISPPDSGGRGKIKKICNVPCNNVDCRVQETDNCDTRCDGEESGLKRGATMISRENHGGLPCDEVIKNTPEYGSPNNVDFFPGSSTVYDKLSDNGKCSGGGRVINSNAVPGDHGRRMNELCRSACERTGGCQGYQYDGDDGEFCSLFSNMPSAPTRYRSDWKCYRKTSSAQGPVYTWEDDGGSCEEMKCDALVEREEREAAEAARAAAEAQARAQAAADAATRAEGHLNEAQTHFQSGRWEQAIDKATEGLDELSTRINIQTIPVDTAERIESLRSDLNNMKNNAQSQNEAAIAAAAAAAAADAARRSAAAAQARAQAAASAATRAEQYLSEAQTHFQSGRWEQAIDKALDGLDELSTRINIRMIPVDTAERIESLTSDLNNMRNNARSQNEAAIQARTQAQNQARGALNNANAALNQSSPDWQDAKAKALFGLNIFSDSWIKEGNGKCSGANLLQRNVVSGDHGNAMDRMCSDACSRNSNCIAYQWDSDDGEYCSLFSSKPSGITGSTDYRCHYKSEGDIAAADHEPLMTLQNDLNTKLEEAKAGEAAAAQAAREADRFAAMRRAADARRAREAAAAAASSYTKKGNGKCKGVGNAIKVNAVPGDYGQRMNGKCRDACNRKSGCVAYQWDSDDGEFCDLYGRRPNGVYGSGDYRCYYK